MRKARIAKKKFMDNFDCINCPRRLKCTLLGTHEQISSLYKSVFANIYVNMITRCDGDKFLAGIKFERKRCSIWRKIPREGHIRANKKIKEVVRLLRHCTFKKS